MRPAVAFAPDLVSDSPTRAEPPATAAQGPINQRPQAANSQNPFIAGVHVGEDFKSERKYRRLTIQLLATEQYEMPDRKQDADGSPN